VVLVVGQVVAPEGIRAVLRGLLVLPALLVLPLVVLLLVRSLRGELPVGAVWWGHLRFLMLGSWYSREQASVSE
jgi:hypothetical protein